MLLRRVLLPTALIGSAMVWACSSCSGPMPSAAFDAGADVHKSKDGGFDAGPLDASEQPDVDVDAGFNPFIGNWAPIPGAPAFCKTRYTQSPDKDISEWQFKTCVSNRPGCQRFVQDWSTFGREVMTFPVYEPVMLANGKAMIAYQREWSNQLGSFAEMSIVQELGGKATLAVGNGSLQDPKSDCSARVFVGVAGPVTLDYVTVNASTSAYFALASWGSPSIQLQAEIPPAAFGGEVFPAMARGTATDVFTMNQAGGGAVPVWHGATNTISLAAQINSEAPRAVGGMAVVKYFDPPYGLRLVKPDATWVQIQTPQAMRITNEFAVDRANGDQLVWVESEFGNPYKNSVLWTSPFATSAVALQPRAVAAVSDAIGYGATEMVANVGVALYRVSDTTARVVRLSDGWGWDFTVEAGDAFMRPLWVDDNEIWVAIADASKPYDKRDMFGVLRLSRTLAGPATVPPGL